MKHVFVLCLFSAFFISRANCDCIAGCADTFQSAIRGARNEDQACPIARTYVKCLETSCNMNVTSYLKTAATELKTNFGFSCDLSSAAKTVSSSFLTALAALLLAGYKTFL